MLLTNERELNLLKTFLYPRVVEVIIRILVEKGYIKPFKHYDFVAYVVLATILVYFFVFEPSVLPMSYVNAVRKFTR